MTTPTAVDPPTPTVFGRAAAAEWGRLVTVRSTWWSLLAAAALMVFVGAMAGASHDLGEPAPIWVPTQFAIAPGQFAFLLVVLLAVTGEYSTGAILSSLQWVPRRGVLLAARGVVLTAFVTVCSVIVAAGANAMTWGFLGAAAEVVPSDIAASLGRIALVVAFGSVLALGLGLLLRSTAGSLTAVFLLILALPVALGNTPVPALVSISDALPGRAIVSLLVTDEVELTRRAVATVMIVWTTAPLAAGGWSLLRRDAT